MPFDQKPVFHFRGALTSDPVIVAATAGIQIYAEDAQGEEIVLDRNVMIGSWVPAQTNDGSDTDTFTATVTYAADVNYTFAIAYTDRANNENDGVNYAGGTVAPEKFTVDDTNPEGTLTYKNQFWTELLDTITFHLWDKKLQTVKAEASDVTSGYRMQYYKTDRTDRMTAEMLNGLKESDWTEYTEAITVDPDKADERLTVYLKVTDYAGNSIYVGTEGIIVENEKPVIDLTVEAPHSNGIYNKDFKITIAVAENEIYSGLKSVSYAIYKDGNSKPTQNETWTLLEADRSSYADLVNAFSKEITVIAAENNSSNIRLEVQAEDNAGNVHTVVENFDIDITAPSLKVTYQDVKDSCYKVVDSHGYFNEPRKVTLTVTERSNHFEADVINSMIKITQNGTAMDLSDLKWTPAAGQTPDEDTHTAVIDLPGDYHYTFGASYTDKAGWDASVDLSGNTTPEKFTVDCNEATGTVKVGELGTWIKLLEKLTFGLWSPKAVDVTVTAKDPIAGVESVSYYKTDSKTLLTETDLKALTAADWKKYEPFTVSPNERFTVYVRIVDNCGNVKYLSSDGIIVDDKAPEFKPALENEKPQLTLAPKEKDVNGFFPGDVTVAVKVEDPTVNGSYAGLKKVWYEISNMGKITKTETIYEFAPDDSIDWSDLTPLWEDEILVSSAENNSNDVVVTVYAVDNAGNESSDSIKLKIDTTDPVIDVIHSNNTGDTTFTDSTYFKADRPVTIKITERNFNPEKVVLTITNTDSVIPVLSSWKKTEGTGNGDDTVYEATILFNADGDYTFAISCTDEVGRKNQSVDYNGALAPEKFTVDKTLPILSVTYDNNSVLNGNYYKAQRIATIVVTEHNFDATRVVLSLTATDLGKATTLPTVGTWTSNGDVHTLKVTYAADALYTFDFDYTDKAGNATANIAQQTFYVDKTAPELKIQGIVDESANNSEGNIGFVMTATDTNFDKFEPVLTAVVKSGDSFETKTLQTGKMTDTTNGEVFTVENIEADGLYQITCTVVDKAGNAYTKVTLQKVDGSAYVAERSGTDALVTFSVNREGSTYGIDEKTLELLDQYYVQNVRNDLVLVETNADPLQSYTVTLNGKELVKDTDYTVEEAGGEGAWKKYTYTVKKELFEAEGEYKLVVSSKDKAENDAFSDVKDAAIEFVVDRTAPVISISGLAEGGRYQVERQTVVLMPTDDGGELKSLIVRLVDKDGALLQELINLSGEELLTALESSEGQISFEIGEGLYQNVQIICADCAVNEENQTNVYDETVLDVSVSSNAFMIFWANRSLRWGSIAGVVLLTGAIVLVVLLKKKKKEEAK